MSIAAEIRKAALGPLPESPGIISSWTESSAHSDACYLALNDYEQGCECCTGFPACSERGDDITPRTFLLLVAEALEGE